MAKKKDNKIEEQKAEEVKAAAEETKAEEAKAASEETKDAAEKPAKKMSKGMIALIVAVVIAACGFGGWREGYTRYRG